MAYRFKAIGDRVQHKSMDVAGIVYDFRYTQDMHRVFVVAEPNPEDIIRFDCTESHLERA
jgi:hypothetical protein